MFVIFIIVVLLAIYIYSLKLSHPNYKIVTYNDIKDKVKSGDIILFVSLDTINQLYMGSYYTHIGVIYKKNNITDPHLVESFNPHRMPVYPEEAKSGIVSCDLEHRLNSYRGFVLYKELAKPISEKTNLEFAEFIEYAKKNMQYDENTVSGEVAKIVFNTPFNTHTNCGQFTALILIKLGLLSFKHFKERRKHHLIWTSNLTKLKNNFYKTPVYVYADYFKLNN